jgi:Cft2 family RNA processing exonuclease
MGTVVMPLGAVEKAQELCLIIYAVDETNSKEEKE